MKLLSYVFQERERVGMLSKDGQYIFPLPFVNMNDLIAKSNLPELMRQYRHWNGPKISIRDIKLLAPIPEPQQDVICLGVNYAAHAEEAARFQAEAFLQDRPYAIYFSKRVHRMVAPGEEIQGHFDMVDALDYETELAFIIGKNARNVSEEAARDYILGYTILNDISARNLQTNHKQWYFGKSLDGFTPMGPWIVTADEFDFPPKLNIMTRVNGELRQNSNTSLLLYGIAHIICELSRGMTLKAGTIVATGTPSGVGMGMDPPVFLKLGDQVECEIEGIGVLSNRVGH